MPPVLMRVHKYIPDRLYGFVLDPESDRQAFFHLGVFDSRLPDWSGHQRCAECSQNSCNWADTPPPPILGETVSVQVDFDSAEEDKAPRARRVERQDVPVAVEGKVETYDAGRGYGFAVGEDGETYHLHNSELLDGRIPRVGQVVMFYAGVREDRPRACHVRVCP